MGEDTPGGEPATDRGDPSSSAGVDEADEPGAPRDPTGQTEPGEEPIKARERDVVVPLPLYKIVTVFSTLISGTSVVLGFIVLDKATQRASAPAGEIDAGLAILGVALIAAGGAVYAFSGRFRAPGMGTPKTEADEETNNG